MTRRNPVHPGPCKKRGPYLPVGDIDWVCLTHDVDLVRVSGDWASPARRTDMVCPVGEPHLL